MTVYHWERTPSVSWQELQMARGKLKGGKFTLVGMGWKHPFFSMLLQALLHSVSIVFHNCEYHIAGTFTGQHDIHQAQRKFLSEMSRRKFIKMCSIVKLHDIIAYYTLYVYTHLFCSTGEDASSCVVHLINDGVVVNGYDVSIQFLGSRSVRSYLCKMDDGSFYACERNQH